MFKRKVVLVTGDASGFSQETSLAFARQSANIAAVELVEKYSLSVSSIATAARQLLEN